MAFLADTLKRVWGCEGGGGGGGGMRPFCQLCIIYMGNVPTVGG